MKNYDNNLTEQAKEIIAKRYAQKNDKGEPIETWSDIVKRVVDKVIGVEAKYKTIEETNKLKEEYYDILGNLEFLPNSPCLFNAGTQREEGKCYMACFALKVEDSLDSIMENLHTFSRICKGGGGCGIDFSNIRPVNSPIKSSHGKSLGAIRTMEMFVTVGLNLTQGGVREMACLFTLDISHPEVIDFIKLKSNREYVKAKGFHIANISVNITKEFLQAVEEDKNWELKFKGKIYKTVKARYLWNLIGENAWKTGDPGAVFIDNVTKNKEQWILPFAAKNPCLTGDMKLLTADGYKTFEELNGKTFKIININGEITKGKVWYSGNKECIEIKFMNNDIEPIKCTPDHKFKLIDGTIKEAKDLKRFNRLMPYINLKNINKSNKDLVLAGFITGDGNLTRLNSSTHLGLEINIGKDDYDIAKYFNLKVKGKICYSNKAYDIAKKYNLSAKILPERELPKLKDNEIADFLTGLFSANGSVVYAQTNSAKKISFKTTSSKLKDKLIEYLKKLDIYPALSVNKAKKVKWHNGEYISKESYDIAINRWVDICKFAEKINFIQKYKQEKLKQIIIDKSPCILAQPKNIGKYAVYDFNEEKVHWGVVNGFQCKNCSEIDLSHGGCCNLGSINLNKILNKDNSINWEKFKYLIHMGIRFLDNVIDATNYPTPLNEEIMKKERILGLGITGLHDILIKNKLKYGSDESINFIEKLMKFFKEEAYKASEELAKERDVPKLLKEKGINRRNLRLTTIAPCGTLSRIMGGVSFGCEPVYSFYYKSNLSDFTFEEINNNLIDYAKNNNLSINEVIKMWKNNKLPEYFIIANQLTWKEHLNMLAILQKYIDNSISKTINLPKHATEKEILLIYKKAYELNCKGITIYRDGSLEEQALTTSESENKIKERPKIIKGYTSKKQTACSKLYIDLKEHNEKPFEVFISNLVTGAGCSSNITAISILISLLLRAGVTIEEIHKRLSKIKCSACVALKSKGEIIDGLSCPATITQTLLELQEYMNTGQTLQEKKEKKILVCPECGIELNEDTLLKTSASCWACLNCGYSKCD